MSLQVIGIGAAADDGTGDPLRTAFGKANDNFSELYTLLGSSGTLPTLTSGRLVVGASAGVADFANLTYTETSGPRLQVGSSGTSDGITIGYAGISGVGAIWAAGVGTKNNTTAAFMASTAGNTYINAPSGGNIYTYIAGATLKQTQSSTAGAGPSITAGTATTDVNALSATQTWNAAGVAFTAEKTNVTNTASAASSLLRDWQVGSVSMFAIHKTGAFGGVGTTFANAPSAPWTGMIQNFTDSNTATWGATIAGGGANNVLARYNGANWTVVGA